jgi:S-DNA-T family DNA segregation ATPase FtsK/SpoIIIE
MLLQQRLQRQADRIEAVLAAHHAPARVTGGHVTPRTIQFHLVLAPTTRLSRVESLVPEIALALGAAEAHVTRAAGLLHLEIPRDDARALRLLELYTQVERDPELKRALRVAGTTLLGLTSQGLPLLIRLGTAGVPHVLIAGTTGSGKSEAARTLLAALVMYQPARAVQLLLVDPKGSDLQVFDSVPHLLCPVVQKVEDAQTRLEWLVEEMVRRQASKVTRPRIVVLIDEMADLLLQGGSELETSLTRLVQRGRSAGICLVGCTQKPTAGVLGNLVTANFPVRLVGKVTSAQEALVAAGVSRSGAERLAGRGDFLLIADGEKTRVQIAHFPRSDDAAFRLRAGIAVHAVDSAGATPV